MMQCSSFTLLYLFVHCSRFTLCNLTLLLRPDPSRLLLLRKSIAASNFKSLHSTWKWLVRTRWNPRDPSWPTYVFIPINLFLSLFNFYRTVLPSDSPPSAVPPRSPPTAACPAVTLDWPRSTTCAMASSALRTSLSRSSVSFPPPRRPRASTSWPWAPRWTALWDGE